MQYIDRFILDSLGNAVHWQIILDSLGNAVHWRINSEQPGQGSSLTDLFWTASF